MFNASFGLSASCINSIIHYVAKVKARDWIAKRFKKWKVLKEHLAQYKKVTAGQIYHGGSCRLGSDVFQETKKRIGLKQKKEEDSQKTKTEAHKALCATLKGYELTCRRISLIPPFPVYKPFHHQMRHRLLTNR